MVRQASILPILIALLVSMCISRVQAFGFEDLLQEKIDKKLEKFCYIPGLDFLCPEEEEDDDELSVSKDEGKLRKRVWASKPPLGIRTFASLNLRRSGGGCWQFEKDILNTRFWSKRKVINRCYAGVKPNWSSGWMMIPQKSANEKEIRGYEGENRQIHFMFLKQ
jgi:hypothetical protein